MRNTVQKLQMISISFALLFLLAFLSTVVLSQTGHTSTSWGCDGCPSTDGTDATDGTGPAPTTTGPVPTPGPSPTVDPTPTPSPTTTNGDTTTRTDATDQTDQTDGTDGTQDEHVEIGNDLMACLLQYTDPNCRHYQDNVTFPCSSEGRTMAACDTYRWGFDCENGTCEETFGYGECHYQVIVLPGAC